ncbi:Holliday junction resolvase RuvX [Patescibacteria group bacterium]|nr:Holliday junction resolvase RuvX [Patescibacteria group bacterium]MBU1754949.1 Holliday junction resolvase RuvX [Patescibacteria group bacterium]
MRYLGIDFGTKRVGLALSDEAGAMGFPHSIVPNDSRLLDELTALIEREKVGGIVMGESRNSNGDDNAVMKPARELAKDLEAATGLPVHFEFEAFTTQEASRDFEGERRTGKFLVDASAAAIILTSYLSHN